MADDALDLASEVSGLATELFGLIEGVAASG